MSDIPKDPLYPAHGNSPSRHESLPSGMYSRPKELGAICEHKNLARSCESCDHTEDLAELSRTKEMLEEAKKSAKAGWDRHAEKDRAYGAALKERDDARALAEQRAKEIAGLRGERDGLDSAGRTMGALLAESESQLKQALYSLKIYFHAHETGNGVPPNLVEQARAALEGGEK